MKFLSSIFGGTFAAKAATETRISDLLMKNARLSIELRDALESLEDMKAEAHRHSEAAAAARLRNADLQRRLDATLQALDGRRNAFDELKAENDLLKATGAALAEEATSWKFTAEKNHEHQMAAVKEASEAKRIAGLTLKQFETYQDAVKMLVERGALSPIEVAQLNLGTFIPGVDGLPPTIEFGDVTEGKTSIDFGMKSQATEAKYRQTKEHFQRYQAAVTFMLDQLNGLGQKNHVTKEDLRKLRDIRTNLSLQLKRTI